MKISAMTVLRNAVTLDYPFLESIRSVLPLCDEFVAVIGSSDDGTLDAVRGLNEERIRIVETVWSDKVQPRMSVLAQQTNVGLHLCEGDWVVYLQGNEVLHERSIPLLRAMMEDRKDDPRVEAMLLERLTFWGDYGHMIPVYPERFKFSPRIVRPYIGTYAIRDAMSVAVFDGFSVTGRYPRAMDTGENVYRYGYVCTPEQLVTKVKSAVHLERFREKRFDESSFYRVLPRRFVREFTGGHPAVMNDRIGKFTQRISMDDRRWRTKPTFKEFQRLVETRFYERYGVPGFRNKRYRLVGGYQAKERTC